MNVDDCDKKYNDNNLMLVFLSTVKSGLSAFDQDSVYFSFVKYFVFCSIKTGLSLTTIKRKIKVNHSLTRYEGAT